MSSLAVVRRVVTGVYLSTMLAAIVCLGAVRSTGAQTPACPPFPQDQTRVYPSDFRDWLQSVGPGHNAFVQRYMVPMASRSAVGTGHDPCASSWGVTTAHDETVGDYINWSSIGPARFPSSCFQRLLQPENGSVVSYNPWVQHPDYFKFGPVAGFHDRDADAFGFGLGINLLSTVSPGDYLPVGDTIAANTECLVPNADATATTGWQGITRPTLEGKVDLVSGLPLARVTDLELPFDGATFRLVRTRSGRVKGNHPTSRLSDSYSEYTPDGWWDWTGLGWMASENPILFIDSTMPDVVGNREPTCYLMLDAFHTIPFERLAGTSRYEAPPRFRATLEGQGKYTEATRTYSSYKVTLYDRRLTYTFVTITDDVPSGYRQINYLADPNRIDPNQDYTRANAGTPLSPWQLSSFHERPFLPDAFAGNPAFSQHDPYLPNVNPGYGVPFYGICTNITDNSGHSVEINYCKSVGKQLGNGDPAAQPSDECECQQNCLAKGQIKYIKLRSNGQVIWTLVYAHRLFAGLKFPSTIYDIVTNKTPAEDPGRYEMHGTNAMDCIYAFDRDIPDSLLTNACLTMHFINDASFDRGADPIELYNNVQSTNATRLPTDWKHRVRYNYATYSGNESVTPDDGQVPFSSPWRNECWAAPVSGQAVAPILIGTTVTSRSQAGNDAKASIRHRVYHYDLRAGEWLIGNQGASIEEIDTQDDSYVDAVPMLTAIFEEEDIKNIVQAPLGQEFDNTPHLTAEMIARQAFLGAFDPVPMTPSQIGALKRFANASWERSPVGNFPDAATGCPPRGLAYAHLVPSVEALTTRRGSSGEQRAFIALEKNRLAAYNYGRAGTATLRDDTGRSHFYRLVHIQVYPGEVPDDCYAAPPPNAVLGQRDYTLSPMPSAYVNPYQWHSYTRTGASATRPGYLEPGDMSSPRWVMLIDEFDSAEHRDSESDAYSGEAAYKKGLINRRVVEMNPAGMVLRNRAWRFQQAESSTGQSPTTSVLDANGVGEEFDYLRVAQYFNGTGKLPTTGSDPVPTSVANEVILVRKRSIGWSVADNLGQGDTRGLANFFEYDVFQPPSGVVVPWAERVQLVAEGVQKGVPQTAPASAPKAYSRQVVRDPSKPSEVLTEIKFATERASLLTTANVPTPAGWQSAPDTSLSPTWFSRTVSETGILVDRTVVHAPRQQRPNGEWYFPIETEVYDDRGNLAWSVNGLVRDPSNPMADAAASPQLSSLIFSFYVRDSSGRTTASITDAQASGGYSGPNGISGTVPAYPTVGGSNWSRIAPVAPMHFATVYAYDKLGVRDVYFSDPSTGVASGVTGARRAIRREIYDDPDATVDGEPGEQVRQFDLKNLVASGSGFVTNTDAELRIYVGKEAKGNPQRTAKIRLNGPITFDVNGDMNVPDYTEVAYANYVVDADGRAQNIEAAELVELPTPHYESLSKRVNDLGEVYRSLDPDGTITRKTRDALGHELRTYMGTCDSGWGISAFDPDLAAGHPDDGTYNMVLTERLEYGTAPEDVWQPTVARRYRKSPSWATTAYHVAPTPEIDVDGAATQTSYDWRMRAVRSDSYAEGAFTGSTKPRRLQTTLTYLDNLDRPTLVVVYGEDGLTSGEMLALPTDLDPTGFTPQSTRPKISRFFAAGLNRKPMSVTEYLYDLYDQATETRRYDIAWAGSPATPTDNLPYLADFVFRGQGGTPVFELHAGGAATVTLLDGMNRAAVTQSIAPYKGSSAFSYQLSRSEMTYDGDGNVIDTSRFDRADDTGGDVLGSTNSVRSRSVAWFDTNKRMVASAELGTEDPSNRYVWHAASFNRATCATPTWTASSGFTRQSLPASALLTVSVYDTSGRLRYAVDATGVATEHRYSPSGKLVEKIENATATYPRDRRSTKYAYRFGRLVELSTAPANAQASSNGTPPASQQTTRVEYGAELVDSDYNVVSMHNGLVGRMLAPNLTTGSPSAAAVVTLRYFLTGNVAERTDARGVTFRYSYDLQGSLKSTEVGHYEVSTSGSAVFSAGYPTSMTPAGGVPVDRVGFVEFEYDESGRLIRSTARTGRSGSIVAQDVNEFSERGDLAAEYQAHGAVVAPSTTPKISYNWLYLPFGTSGAETGRHRLTSMGYPVQDNLAARVVTLGYGSSTSVDEKLDRVADIATSTTGTASSVATFAYSGFGRRIASTRNAGAIAMDLRASASSGLVGFSGIDALGRTSDLHFQKASNGQTLYRAEYSYDPRGNRSSTRLTQAPESGTAQVNLRSTVYSYDDLNRLVQVETGSLLSGSSAPTIDPTTRQRLDHWNLDELGNWNAKGAQGQWGRQSSGNLDNFGTAAATPGATSDPDAYNVLFPSNNRNQMTSILFDSNLNVGRYQQIQPTYDANGNLTFDGSYFYQYDAWNRLIQVNRVKWTVYQQWPDGAAAAIMASGTVITPGGTPEPGVLLKHFTYDGLGRLIRVQSPFPNPESLDGLVRSERFYYDGIRRIQEVAVDPLVSIELGLESGNTSMSNAASQAAAQNAGSSQAAPIDGEATTMSFEQGQLQGIGATPNANQYLAREYIWGPGDSGIDELLVQYDRSRIPGWTIQDAGGDIVALCVGTGSNVGVAAQYTYDAYGECNSAVTLLQHSPLHAGHKALFVDRLDAPVVNAQYEDTVRLIPFAHNLYQNRNRTYAPQMGRFLQADPNATAMSVLSSEAFNGNGISALVAAVDLNQNASDGLNLYAYLGSNPLTRHDPMGLSSDPFAMVDDYIAESAGSTAAFMERIVGGAKVAAYVGAVVVSMLPFPVSAIAADIGANVLEGDMPPELVTARKYLGYVQLAAVGVMVGKIAYSAAKTAIQYVAKYGLRTIAKQAWQFGKRWSGLGLMERAMEFLDRKPKGRGACALCFTSATLVWTAMGPMPIELVQIDDEVVVRDESGGLDLAPVTAKHVIPGSAVVDLTVAHEDGHQEVIHTTDEHPFWSEEDGWTRVDGLRIGSTLKTIGGRAWVESVNYTSRRETVYNFTVAGKPNYMVGLDGVWVHNCAAAEDAFKRFTASGFAQKHGLDIDDVLAAIEKAKKSIRGTNPQIKNPDIELLGNGSMVIKGQPAGESFDDIWNWLKN